MSPLWSSAESDSRVVLLAEPHQTPDGSARLDDLVSLFEAVALAEGWQPGNALTLWQSRSVYFALEMQEELAGGLQLILPGMASPLPCFDLWPEAYADVGAAVCKRSAHICVLALAEGYRGQGLLFWRLAIEMWRYCVGHGITHVFIEVTPRVMPLYQRLGWPLVVRGELRTHWGEPCYLCSLGIPEVAEAILRRAEHSDYYRQIIAQAFRLPVLLSRAETEAFGAETVHVASM